MKPLITLREGRDYAKVPRCRLRLAFADGRGRLCVLRAGHDGDCSVECDRDTICVLGAATLMVKVKR